MKKLIFALTCTIVAVTFVSSAFAAFVKLDANGQPTSFDADCVMIKDDVTKLIWERKTPLNKGDTYVWADAEIYVDNLAIGVFSKGMWRLPTLRELATIADFTKMPAIDETNYFTYMGYNKYWTQTNFAMIYPETSAWFVNFLDGSFGQSDKTATNYVVAVRNEDGNTATLPPPTFASDNVQKIVTETNAVPALSGLVWQKTPSAVIKTWAAIDRSYLDTIPGVKVDGVCRGWKLPTLQELRSIVNYEKGSSPATYSNFDFSASSAKFWTATSSVQYSNQAWYVDFNFNAQTGVMGMSAKTNPYLVWAVVDITSQATNCSDTPDYPLGDITHDDSVDLADVIAGLRVLDGIDVTVYTDKEVNGDSKIGLEEVIYALQVTAALRTQ